MNYFELIGEKQKSIIKLEEIKNSLKFDCNTITEIQRLKHNIQLLTIKLNYLKAEKQLKITMENYNENK